MKKYIFNCKVCKKEFSAKRNDAEFCSAKCKTVQYRLDYPQHFKQWYQKNREKNIEKAIRWKNNNPEKVKIIRDRSNAKRQENPYYRLGDNMTSAISTALKGKKAGRHWETLVGYTLEKLMQRLSVNFKKGMTWENYGKWHIDHKKPQSLFHYRNVQDKEFKLCWSLANLQPLWAMENFKKSNQYF